MESIIIYGSKYGSTRRYAEKLSEKTGISAVSCKEVSELSCWETIVYMGALYAGGVMGLAKTLRHFSLGKGQKLIIVTVGLSDPEDAQTVNNIQTSLQTQLPTEVVSQAKIFHLRGGIDYRRLSPGHRTVMALLHQALRRIPDEKQSAENRALLETYGKHVDFTDFNALEPIIRELNG